MVDFVKDKGLVVLVGQVDAAAPGRSHASDGFVGDPAHAARDSDHNPQDSADADAPGNPDHQVDAADITHDPAHGADMGVMTEAIRVSKDRRVKYVIFNRRIFSGTLEARRAGLPAYTWGPYSGSDPHTGHAHVSVEDLYHDQTQPWSIGIGDTMPLTEKQLVELDIRVEALDRRMRALTTGEFTPYSISWTADAADQETMSAVVQLKYLVDTVKVMAADIEAIMEHLNGTTPPASGSLTPAELAASLRAQADMLDPR